MSAPSPTSARLSFLVLGVYLTPIVAVPVPAARELVAPPPSDEQLNAHQLEEEEVSRHAAEHSRAPRRSRRLEVMFNRSALGLDHVVPSRAAPTILRGTAEEGGAVADESVEHRTARSELVSAPTLADVPVDGTLVHGGVRLVADHGFVEVMRFGTPCMAAAEGLSAGFEGDCGEGYTKMGRPELSSCDSKKSPPAQVGYGCWFFFSEPVLQRSTYGSLFKVTEGSGVAVNVGKSLRVDTRVQASRALGLPCADPPLCERPGTVQDKLYCERAVHLGYDSIQFARPHIACLTPECMRTQHNLNPPEIVICSGGCMTQRVGGACPPSGVQLRRVSSDGYAQDLGPCRCSDESDVLNCGRGGQLYGRPDEATQRW